MILSDCAETGAVQICLSMSAADWGSGGGCFLAVRRPTADLILAGFLDSRWPSHVSLTFFLCILLHNVTTLSYHRNQTTTSSPKERRPLPPPSLIRYLAPPLPPFSPPPATPRGPRGCSDVSENKLEEVCEELGHLTSLTR